MVANAHMLGGVLRGDLGFLGHVVSDCGAVGNVDEFQHFAKTPEEGAALALRAGTDLNCGHAYALLNVSIERGLASMQDVDTALGRTLTGRFARGEFNAAADDPFRGIKLTAVGSNAHVELARRAAQESLVLLKNVAGRLPLKVAAGQEKVVVAVIGHSANDSLVLLGNYHGDPSQSPVTPLEAITARVDANVNFAQGAWVTGEGTWDFSAAIQAARRSDVAVIFVGGSAKGTVDGITHFDTTEKEGLDRTELTLPGVQTDLIKAIASQTDTPIVLVLINGGPLAIEWAVASPRVEAILEGWYPGQEGGTAIADALFGIVAPAGRLPVTMYHSNYTGQVSERSMDMREFPGRTHRFLQVPALYEFGFGLSYSTWTYGSVKFDSSAHRVSFVLTNTGNVTSDHVVIVYSALHALAVDQPSSSSSSSSSSPSPPTSPPSTAFGITPQQSVVAFTRLRAIAAGATVPVNLLVDANAFSLVDTLGRRNPRVKGMWTLFVKESAGNGSGHVRGGSIDVLVD